MDIVGAAGSFSDLLTESLKLIGSSVERRRKLGDDQWALVLEALALLKSFSSNHFELVRASMSPLIKRNDLATTVQLYEQVVEMEQAPNSYAWIRGVLEGAVDTPTFHHEATANSLKAVLEQLGRYQHAIFLYVYTSSGFLEALQATNRLCELLDMEPPAAQTDRANYERERSKRTLFVRESYKNFANWLIPENELWTEKPIKIVFDMSGTLAPLDTSHDVVLLARNYCAQWINHLENVFYRGRGLHHAIGRLEARRYAK